MIISSNVHQKNILDLSQHSSFKTLDKISVWERTEYEHYPPPRKLNRARENDAESRAAIAQRFSERTAICKRIDAEKWPSRAHYPARSIKFAGDEYGGITWVCLRNIIDLSSSVFGVIFVRRWAPVRVRLCCVCWWLCNFRLIEYFNFPKYFFYYSNKILCRYEFFREYVGFIWWLFIILKIKYYLIRVHIFRKSIIFNQYFI